jgi:hypothetical protein
LPSASWSPWSGCSINVRDGPLVAAARACPWDWQVGAPSTVVRSAKPRRRSTAALPYARMALLVYLIILFFGGLIIGALARLLLPGQS